VFYRARKRFGQNFLQDARVVRHILEVLDARPGEALLEIGPGRGAITRGLLRAAGGLIAVELDRDLARELPRRLEGLGRLQVIQTDALRLNLADLPDPGPFRVVGNLPYNVSTPLLFHLLEQADRIRDMHFMLQREVVERLAAGPGGKTYGRLSVMVQARCRVEPLFQVGPGAFRPRPKVESAFVRLLPRHRPVYEPAAADCFEVLVLRAFSQRRKTLRKSLRALVPDGALEAVGIDPRARPETLAVEDFARLAAAVECAPL